MTSCSHFFRPGYLLRLDPPVQVYVCICGAKRVGSITNLPTVSGDGALFVERR